MKLVKSTCTTSPCTVQSVQMFKFTGETDLEALSLDPNSPSTTFWVGDHTTGHALHFNITKSQPDVTLSTGAAATLGGICVEGGFSAGQINAFPAPTLWRLPRRLSPSPQRPTRSSSQAPLPEPNLRSHWPISRTTLRPRCATRWWIPRLLNPTKLSFTLIPGSTVPGAREKRTCRATKRLRPPPASQTLVRYSSLRRIRIPA